MRTFFAFSEKNIFLKRVVFRPKKRYYCIQKNGVCLMKKWLLLGALASMLIGAETYYAYGDLEEKDNGLLVEVKTQKPAHGIGRFYYESGELRGETPFQNGVREGMGKIYYKNGAVKNETPFHHDRIEGVKKEYFESGKLQSTVSFKSGLAEGIATMYYPNGAIQSETPFHDNKAEGTSKIYNEQGRLVRTIEFQHGKAVKGFDYDQRGAKQELSRDQLSFDKP
jgi:antitoxin component YwqK of YwqJK toxin-antitoxin module